MIRRIRGELACERLARIVETTRNSFEREQYRRHRQAALKGLGRDNFTRRRNDNAQA
jgi:hypothetical protein